MRIKIINFILGTVVLKAEGIFPERIINIAKEMGIFIQNIRANDSGIIFTVSLKGSKKLLSASLPENIDLKEIKSNGIPCLLGQKKTRVCLFAAPVIIFILLFISTQFIWNVNIIDADSATEERLLKALSELGVKRGALKVSIDPSVVKDKLLIQDESLMWIWVDIKGASAIVRFAERTPAPKVFDENEHYNIYSAKNAAVTRIIAETGQARVKVGDTVSEGTLLIEGVMPINEEEFKQIHATGLVYGNVWEEKQFNIPKKNAIRTPTGEKKQHLTIFFKNFPLKLFINSSILYTNYDIIENNRSLGFLPVTFNKKEYYEVDVTYEDNNALIMRDECEQSFYKELSDKGYSISHNESFMLDKGDSYLLTVRAVCEEPIWIEKQTE